MTEPVKKRKPPACDHCKAKRVLCHPNPDGCPRCLEKGIECTTTPVVRRKPTRKKPYDVTGAAGSVEPLSAGSTSAFPPASASGTPALVGASEGSLDAFLPVPGFALATDPTLTISSAAATPFPAFAPAVPPTGVGGDLVASTSQIPYGSPTLALVPTTSTDWATLSPTLVKHLLECFRNTSHFDHPIVRGASLRELLDPVGFRLELLAPHARVFVYATLAVGALMSYDPAIIGTEGPSASSFQEMELLCSELKDLRQFGRRRWTAFVAMRNVAVWMAKEAGVLLDASLHNAASCFLLDYLTHIGDAAAPNRPYLSAYMNHVRVLCDTGEIDIAQGAKATWAIHMSADMFSELASGRLSSTPTDQLALAGALEVDLEALERTLRRCLLDLKLQDVWWREALHPFALAHLGLCRELADKVLSTHARRKALDEAAVAHFLERLRRFRAITSLHFELHDKRLEVDERTLFPHATPRRIRYTTQMMLRGIRNFVAISGNAMVLPFYRELRRRLAEAQESLHAVEGNGREAQQALVERVELLVRQFGRVFLDAATTMIDSMERAPYIVLIATRGTVGIIDWGLILLHEIEHGAFQLDDQIVNLLEKVASTAKVAGYSYSSSHIDAVIARIESIVWAHRFANAGHPGSTLPSVASTQPSQVAFLSETTPSNETSPKAAPPDLGFGADLAFDFDALVQPSAAEMPAFSPEQLAQLFASTTTGADGDGGLGSADGLAGWGPW